MEKYLRDLIVIIKNHGMLFGVSGLLLLLFNQESMSNFLLEIRNVCINSGSECYFLLELPGFLSGLALETLWFDIGCSPPPPPNAVRTKKWL